MQNSYVALDLETTGLRPKYDRILEIGAVRVVDGVETETYETFVDSGIPIPESITELTGITQEMVTGGPGLREAIDGFLEFAGSDVLLGHNLLFDYSFMKRNVINQGGEFERRGLDTLAIARVCLPKEQGRALDKLAVYFGIEQRHHHRALDDALTASRIYGKLKERYAQERPSLFEPVPLQFRIKKEGPITNSQKVYLRDLLKYHRIENNVKIDELTKSEASRMIDAILLRYGRITR